MNWPRPPEKIGFCNCEQRMLLGEKRASIREAVISIASAERE